MKINKYLYELEDKDTFYNVTRRINEYKKENPDKKIISLGIGDVSRPVIKPIIEAMHKAVDDLSDMKTFKGYGSYHGYEFLRNKILDNDYKNLGFTKDEVYISNGTKTDSTSILELFDINSSIVVSNPMYPIYKEGSKCLSRSVTILEGSEENNFIPGIPKEKYDLIYICSPGNPTGIAYTYKELEKWVKYALENNSVILFDNVYYPFITSEDVPKTIYEIKDARKVAIEFRSFSKSASFTGVRCSYYLIPNDIYKDVNKLWNNRTIERFNGTDYIAQKGAEASYLDESQRLIKENIGYYLNNAEYLRNEFTKLGFKIWGGINSPFMWVKTKNDMSCWEFFEFMLKELNIIVIPGSIFGSNGKKYFRISALGENGSLIEAVERLKNYYEKEI